MSGRHGHSDYSTHGEHGDHNEHGDRSSRNSSDSLSNRSRSEPGGRLFDEGMDDERVLEELSSRLEGDLRFGSGHILGSMCSEPDPFAAGVFTEQLEKNLGDPGLHPSLAAIERETVKILGSMLGGETPAGTLVSGGTEANILALWTAKLRAPKEKRVVVLPESAHFSFDKAASLMDLELRKIPVDRHHRFSLEELGSAVDERVMAMVGIAGTTGLGIVDPIPDMARIAVERDIYFHIDAAFGGFVLPFLEEAGLEEEKGEAEQTGADQAGADQSGAEHYGAGRSGPIPFDFRVEGVSSITIDPHKMGRSPIPAGCILYRNEEIAGISRTNVGYLSGGKTSQQTIVGTRPGAAAAAVWATLRKFGRRGYVRTVRSCMEVTRYLAGQIRRMDCIELMTEPAMNVVGFRPADDASCDGESAASAAALADALRRRGFAVSLFPGFIRITVMPHVSRESVDRFLKEVRDVLS